jgi:predicted membrane metal-binding protein
MNYIYEEFRLSASAQMFTAPILFYYFRQISFISPLANILVSWLISPLMIIGILIAMIGTISWQAGFMLSWFAYGYLDFLVNVVDTLSQIPFASVKW